MKRDEGVGEHSADGSVRATFVVNASLGRNATRLLHGRTVGREWRIVVVARAQIAGRRGTGVAVHGVGVGAAGRDVDNHILDRGADGWVGRCDRVGDHVGGVDGRRDEGHRRCADLEAQFVGEGVQHLLEVGGLSHQAVDAGGIAVTVVFAL